MAEIEWDSSPDGILALISKGEGEEVEFEERIPPDSSLAGTITAFANSNWHWPTGVGRASFPLTGTSLSRFSQPASAKSATSQVRTPPSGHRGEDKLSVVALVGKRDHLGVVSTGLDNVGSTGPGRERQCCP
jgi:hypothetical protein